MMDAMHRAERLREVGRIVATLVEQLPDGLEMVFGPVTRGGIIRTDPKTGIAGPSYRENIRALESTIVALQRDGHLVFNQLAFKSFIDKHRRIWLSKHGRVPTTWHEPLKHDFYAPILETGKIGVGHFILDWRRGNSAKFAYAMLTKQGKQIYEYPQGYQENLAA